MKKTKLTTNVDAETKAMNPNRKQAPHPSHKSKLITNTNSRPQCNFKSQIKDKIKRRLLNLELGITKEQQQPRTPLRIMISILQIENHQDKIKTQHETTNNYNNHNQG